MSQNDYPLEIDAKSVQSLLSGKEDFLLVDCREQDEYEFVHLAGAKHLPMGQTPARVGELEPYRHKRIVVHCHHGGRSQQVVEWLRGRGFTKAQNMTGGIDGWSLEVDSNLPRY